MLDVAEWAKKTVKKSDTFLDVGANVGDVVVAVEEAKLSIAIEGNPYTARKLRERFKGHRIEQAIVIQKLVLDRPGLNDFFLTESPSQSTLYGKRFKAGEGHWEKVEATTIDDILDEYRITGDIVMKMDIELSEPLAWRGMQKHIKQFRAIVMEFMPRIMKYDTENDPNVFLEEIRKHFVITKLDGTNPSEQELTDPKGSKIDLMLTRI